MAIPETIKKLANDIRTKIYGREVRESLAKGIEEAGDIANLADIKADAAVEQVRNIQAQVDQLVVEGDSSVEAAQARVDADGNVFTTLKERLDTKETQFANEIGILNKKTDGIVSVKEYGAKGDGVTDDTLAIQNALNQNGTVVFESGKTYLVTDCLLIGDNIKKIDGCSAKIIFTREQQGSSSSNINSLFNAFDRKSSLAIENIVLQYTGTFDFGYSYTGLVNGIDIRSSNGFSGLYIKNVEAFGFNRAGIQIALDGNYIKNVVIENCYLHHNRVAGVWFGYVDGMKVVNCDLTYNGIETDNATGYGCAGIKDCYSKNVVIQGNNASYNYRKGIDFHSGYNCVITGNICKGNRYYGIYAQLTNIYNSQVQPSGDFIISNNIISDMVIDKDIDQTKQVEIFGIIFGVTESQGNAGIYKSNFIVQGNTISNMDSKNGGIAYPICCITTGLDLGSINISNNLISAETIQSFVRLQEVTGLTGKYTDVSIVNNHVKINTLTDRLIKVRNGSNVRILKVEDNFIEIINNYTPISLIDFADYASSSIIPNRQHSFNQNTLLVNKTDWGSYDPTAIYDREYITMFNNIFNGKKYRDWDGKRYIFRDASIPNSGYWSAGSVVFNTASTSGGYAGWICVAGGTPGTWKGFGLIQS